MHSKIHNIGPIFRPVVYERREDVKPDTQLYLWEIAIAAQGLLACWLISRALLFG